MSISAALQTSYKLLVCQTFHGVHHLQLDPFLGLLLIADNQF